MAGSATTAQFFRERQREAERAAGDATLQNVKERCMRSAKAWSEMAERAERSKGLARSEGPVNPSASLPSGE